MPRIRDLVNQADAYRTCLANRNALAILPHFEEGLKLFYDLKKNRTLYQELRTKVNKLSAEYFKTKNEQLAEQSRAMKDALKAAEEEERLLAEKQTKLETVLPNWHDPSVPVGAGDDLEKPLRYGRAPRVWREHAAEFDRLYPGAAHDVTDEKPYHHYEMVGTLVDQERGGDVAQSRFYYELDELVALDLALSLYSVEFFRGRGWNRLMIPPYMMRRAVEEKTTYYEAFEDTIFEIEKDELILIPSSEHPILAYFAERTFPAADLPVRVTAWSPCFRREAGAHGKDTRGIFRVRQFHKTELHAVVKEGEDLAEVDRCCRDIEAFLDSLALPHRTVIVPTGDMDKRALLQLDVQTWMPGQGRYRETNSVATIGTWGSEKWAIRYKTEDERKILVRNIYATGVAVQRMLCAIMENHFDPANATVRIPPALLKYTLGIERIPAPRVAE